MDDKTADLRELYLDVAGEDTLTERQQSRRGTLDDEAELHEQLRAVVSTMRDRFDFHTTLSNTSLARIVREYYRGRSDADIADTLDVARSTVIRARLDLHLLRASDFEAPFALDNLWTGDPEDRSIQGLADRLNVSPSTIRRYRHAVQARRQIREVDDRYRDRFETVLGEDALRDRLTAPASETGLEEALEGQEIDLSM